MICDLWLNFRRGSIGRLPMLFILMYGQTEHAAITLLQRLCKPLILYLFFTKLIIRRLSGCPVEMLWCTDHNILSASHKIVLCHEGNPPIYVFVLT